MRICGCRGKILLKIREKKGEEDEENLVNLFLRKREQKREKEEEEKESLKENPSREGKKRAVAGNN